VFPFFSPQAFEEALKQEGKEPGQKARFDIVCLDKHMPRMNGVEAARCIAALQHTLPPNERATLLGVSASTENSQGWLDAGLNGLMQKPFSRDELTQHIANFFEVT
jgi:CheY-like chemotaxis protein